MEVTNTPNDAGSYEEWRQRFRIVGIDSYKSFVARPHDEIPEKHEPYSMSATALATVGTLDFPNSGPQRSVRFYGNENDSNPDDRLPTVTIVILNPCHAAAEGTLAPSVPGTGCGSEAGRTACYTVVATPLLQE
jgi:hypothetical protein